MSLESFQHTLLRIYGDPGYRTRLVQDPAQIEDVAGLSEAERRSLRTLVEEPEALERYCRSLVNKKFGHLERHFTDALNAFPPVRDAALAGVHATWVLRDVDELVELDEFERLLCDAARAVLEPEPASRFAEWARYLGLRGRARVRALADSGVRAVGEPFTRDAHIGIATGVELERFDGRAAYDEWQPDDGPWYVVAVGDPEIGDARVLELSPTVWNVLDSLTEPVSGAELLARLVPAGRTDVEDAAAAALTRLVELGILTCSGPSEARRREDDPAAVSRGA